MEHSNFTRLSNSYQGPDQNRSQPGREVERGLEYNQGHYQTSRLMTSKVKFNKLVQSLSSEQLSG